MKKNTDYYDSLLKSFTVNSEFPLQLYSQEPAKNGYNFNGYYFSYFNTDSKVTQISSFADIKDYVVQTQDSILGTVYNLYLYPDWVVSSYTITYCDSDGSVLTGLTPETYNVTVDTYLPSYEKEGNVFSGWKIENTETYLTDKITAGTLAENIKLIAVFDMTIYGIEYVIPADLVNSTVVWTGNYTDKYSVNSGSITLPVPQIASYTFDGWYMDAAYTQIISNGILNTSVFIDNPDYADGVSVYAKFSAWPVLNGMIIKLPEFSSQELQFNEYSSQVSQNTEKVTISLDENTVYTTISWYVDGNVQNVSGRSLEIIPYNLNLGKHTVMVVIKDSYNEYHSSTVYVDIVSE